MSFVPRHPDPPDYSALQKPLNQRWPLCDGRGWHARGVPDRRPVAVRVRIVWERDGEEWIHGTATRWTNAVFVRVDDPRLSGFGVWVPASDVHRTGPPAPGGAD